MPIRMSVLLCMSIHMSVHMPAHMSVHMPAHMPTHMSVHIFVHMSVLLRVRPPASHVGWAAPSMCTVQAGVEGTACNFGDAQMHGCAGGWMHGCVGVWCVNG